MSIHRLRVVRRRRPWIAKRCAILRITKRSRCLEVRHSDSCLRTETFLSFSRYGNWLGYFQVSTPKSISSAQPTE